MLRWFVAGTASLINELEEEVEKDEKCKDVCGWLASSGDSLGSEGLPG